MAKYICNGAQCKCTLGTDEGKLEVKSQTKIFIQDKLMATENEKTFSKNFTNCNRQSPNPLCTPDIKAPWTNTKNNVFQTEHKGLLEDSKCKCSYGGEISIIDSKQSDTKNVIFGDYSSESKEISKVYAKVRTLEDYNGEFGFDWLDVDPETMEIQKIQGVPFSDAEYFYKKGNSPQDLGDIIPVNQDKGGAIQVIQENYDLINFCDYVDTPFILLKPGEHATLSLEVFFEGEAQDDYISITGDEFYSFKIDGEEERKDKNDKTTKKKIVANEKLQLTINCSKESLDKKYFFLHTGAKGPREVGGLSMMENKVLKLKFRVIALVSNEGNPINKAKDLFQKFTNAKIVEYLNKNSLNQAGYKIEIENQEMFINLDNPSINIDDYFYAFDKETWTRKKYFGSIIKQKPDVDPTTGNCRIGSWDSVKNECNKIPVLTDVIVNDQKVLGGNISILNEMDAITIYEYKKKLLQKGKSYNNGGIIILADYESPTDTVAFSRTTPLNHYAVFVYLNGIEQKNNYSHEIGHMLGLPHLFYDSKEKDSYRVARENILGNNEPEKIDGKDNPKYNPGIIKYIQNAENSGSDYYGWSNLTALKKDMLEKMRIHDIKRQQNINSIKITKKKFDSYPDSYMINILGGGKISKKDYFSNLNKSLLNSNTAIVENSEAIKELENRQNNQYENLAINSNYIKSDMVFLLKQNKNYYDQIINQFHLNYIMFKQNKTKNIMDYTEVKLRYMHNQVRIMRNDNQNYIDIESLQSKKIKQK